MCGIVGYIGKRNISNTLIDGLRKLEYRGYDSSGVALLNEDKILIAKESGKVQKLHELIDDPAHQPLKNLENGVGIAHTRWATHGTPNQTNSHPHLDDSGKFAVVHNGIIENFAELKKQLELKGHKFTSDTDSEVIPHLIAECYEGDLLQATAAALKQVEGTFGIQVISSHEPGVIIVARRGSPVVIGVGNDEMLVASDVSALIAYTRQVIYLNDDDLAKITVDNFDIRSLDNVPVTREIANIDWDASAAEKDGFDHFMIKEIFEQPTAISNTTRGRLNPKNSTAVLSGLNLTPREMAMIDRVVIAACGTSLYAGMMGKYYFEDLANIPTNIEQAAEFRYRNPIIEPNTLVVATSQSGETADTLAAVREAKSKGAIVAGVCNVVGSTIPRETGRGVYLHAGPEIGVASTKAFTCQVTVLLMMALKFGRGRRLSPQIGDTIIDEIERLPQLIEETLQEAKNIEKIAKKYSFAEDMFFIGRGYLYPVAMEGALKLKEISYIHAEGYHAAELKHGPIALLEEKVPVFALANDLPGKDKIIGNMQECRARKSPVIITATKGDTKIAEHADDVIWVPKCSEYVAPIVTVVALQLFSYYFAKECGCSIDQPRNLAKSVTVE